MEARSRDVIHQSRVSGISIKVDGVQERIDVFGNMTADMVPKLRRILLILVPKTKAMMTKPVRT